MNSPINTLKNLGVGLRRDRNGNYIVMLNGNDKVPFYSQQRTMEFLRFLAKYLNLIEDDYYFQPGDLIALM